MVKKVLLVCSTLSLCILVACSGNSSTSSPIDGIETDEQEKNSSSEQSSRFDKSSSSFASDSMKTMSSSPVNLVLPCRTELVDNCIYGSFVDNRDGQSYKTVTIGTQVWMAENLNYAYLEPTEDEDSSSVCYQNNPENCAKYGRLYLWSAAMDSTGIFSADGKGCDYDTFGRVSHCNLEKAIRGVCPEGWHLPNVSEMKILISAVGGSGSLGRVLKSTSGWKGYHKSIAGVDAYGFSVLPSGDRKDDKSFDNLKGHAFLWNSEARYLYFFYYHDEGDYKSAREKLMFSVRCLMNEQASTTVDLDSAKTNSIVTLASPCKDWNGENCEYGSLTDDRDGKTYKTVTIGSQTWMAENLNYDGLTPNTNSDSTSFCYDGELENCTKYGRLYLWSAAMDSAGLFSADGKGCGSGKECNANGIVRGVCPKGWHLPSRQEFEYLADAVQNPNFEDNLIADSRNPYGFSALAAGGYRSDDGFFVNGYIAYFWSSSEALDAYAYSVRLSDLNDRGGGYYDTKNTARSVRCLKD